MKIKSLIKGAAFAVSMLIQVFRMRQHRLLTTSFILEIYASSDSDRFY